MKLYVLIVMAFLFSGCDIREREMALEKREAALNQKEQELVLKEKTLQLKEESLAQKEKKLDSSLLVDSTRFIYNPAIIGQWNVVMTCTETTCPGSAIGDTKSEKWDISYEGNKILVKAMDANMVASRVYTGYFNGNRYEFTHVTEATATEPVTKITVQLQMPTPLTLEGQREILRTGNCKIVYELKLTKA
ncbi:MAG TPA: hypothetical protein VFQ73_08780 [Flavisolibacter sp.]|nr:hypothetical protein [Flavisolibacter sp.]